MKLSTVVIFTTLNAFAYSTCYADSTVHPTPLEWSALTQQLELTNKKLEQLNVKIEQMADSIHEMKQCLVLAHQSPRTFEQFKKAAGSSNQADDSQLNDMFQKENQAKEKCGLPPNVSQDNY